MPMITQMTESVFGPFFLLSHYGRVCSKSSLPLYANMFLVKLFMGLA
jgi:hypothetical protein